MSISTFFKAVETEFINLFKHPPAWTTTASTTLKFVAPLVETLTEFAAPEAEPAVASIVTLIQGDLAGASAVIKTAGPAPTLLSYLDSINANIAQIEAATGIKDADTQAKVTSAVQIITQEIDAIIAIIPAPTPAPAAS